jgi:hypothetical protein
LAAAGAAPAALLPSAADAFAEVAGPPAFLDPEATRPRAVPAHAGVDRAAAAADEARGGGGPTKRGRAPGEVDLARMAPPLRVRADVDDLSERGGGAVVAAGAARGGGGGGSAAPTALQIAALGGAPAERSAGAAARKRATPAMGVADFLDRGAGGAALPRARQDRKEREQEKRARGQSTHAAWKSEAEMALRQQYD